VKLAGLPKAVGSMVLAPIGHRRRPPDTPPGTGSTGADSVGGDT